MLEAFKDVINEGAGLFVLIVFMILLFSKEKKHGY